MDDDDKELDAFLQLIKKVPSGRRVRGSKLSLYQAIADLKLSDSRETIGLTQVGRYPVDLKLTASQETIGPELTEGMAAMTLSCAAKIKYGKTLIKSYRATRKPRPARDNFRVFFGNFIAMLVERPQNCSNG